MNLFERTASNRNIVFLGRIHEERGIDLLIQIVKSVVSQNSQVKFHIIGDGELLPLLRERLSGEVQSGFCTMYGSLHGEELSSALRKMAMLINCAPVESYGLAMREALMQGLPIFALKNEATMALQQQFPAYVVLFQDAKDAAKSIVDYSTFQEIDRSEVLKIREYFLVDNIRNIDAVAQSWVL
jgi:glycosyltransferase involved in cell wall biosynthesis